MLVSKVSGYLVADFRMTPDTIVKQLDVFEGHLPGLFTSGEAVTMQAFRFGRTKEAFYWRNFTLPAFTITELYRCRRRV